MASNFTDIRLVVNNPIVNSSKDTPLYKLFSGGNAL